MRTTRTLLLATLTVLAVVILAGASTAAASDGSAAWLSAPAEAPPPPSGVSASPYPAELGRVSDIEFWAPNRGVLITAGSGIVPAGLYTYNGAAWQQLSTVCGGTDGRIAFAGQDEFWTVSDQRPGQILPTSGSRALEDVSLCHFQNGKVVGSYAVPLDEPSSYEPMNAAACASPTDCWFGGDLDSQGAFHLYWNGTTLSVVESPLDHEVTSMSVDAGQIYESVQLASTDSSAGDGNTSPTPVLHLIDATQSDPFVDLFPIPAGCAGFCTTLPNYGTDPADPNQPIDPTTLGGFALSSDSLVGATDPQLWAAAGPNASATPATGDAPAHAIVLWQQDANWVQVVPDLVSLPAGDEPLNDTAPGSSGTTPVPEAIAAEPDENAAWLAVSTPNADNQGYVVRIAMSGSSAAAITDQDALGDAQGVGPRGEVSAIACPAAQDCWAATTSGWLFHLTNGAQYPLSTDADYASVITYRPPDGGVPTVETPNANPDQLPVTTVTHPLGGTPTVIRRRRKVKPVVTHVGKAKYVGTTLELPVTTRVRAHLQLIGRRKKTIVVRSKLETLGPGRHILTVMLNPKDLPTSLSLNATAVSTGHRKQS